MSNKRNHRQGMADESPSLHLPGAVLQRHRTGMGLILLGAAFGLVLYGCARGEAAVVLNKAVNICLECIGLG